MALSFNGSTDYLEYAGGYAAEPFSISAWFYPTDDSVTMDIASQGHETAWYVWMRVGMNTSRYAFAGTRASTGSPAYAISTTTATLNAWNHVVGSFYSISDRRVWLNGGGYHRSTNFLNAAPNRMSIGAWCNNGTGDGLFTGYIANVAMWNSGITEAEAILLFNGTSALNLQARNNNLLGYWPLIDDTDPSIDIHEGRQMVHYGTPSIARHPNVQTFPTPAIEVYDYPVLQKTRPFLQFHRQ